MSLPSYGKLADNRPRWLQQLATFIRLVKRDKGGAFGMLIVILLIFCAVFANHITPYDPSLQNLREGKTPPAWFPKGSGKVTPSWAHPLGTDPLGRDLLTRIIYGSRVSLTVGVFGVLLACSLGLIIGMIGGYLGGRVDDIIVNVINIMLGIPYLLLVVVIATVLGRSLINVILIFGITDAPVFVRVTRSVVLRARECGYVEAAVSIGAQNWRILFEQILPNLVGPIITLGTLEMSNLIFAEAGLGFLGLSVPPSVPSWGNMLNAAREYILSYPWMAMWPGFSIMITAVGMNLMGDWLRDIMDPRQRRARR
ncbi:MAG: ABC transporter permease [Anaerolineales bacterium]|nr:ABC transporter permease [Anaerolineales bacterium]